MKKNTEQQPIEYINHDTDEQMEIFGYEPSLIGRILTWLGIILSLGFLRLVFYWKPEWMLKATHRQCKVRDAKTVLLRDKYQQWFVEKIETLGTDDDGSRDDLDSVATSGRNAKIRQNSDKSGDKSAENQRFLTRVISVPFSDTMDTKNVKLFINKRWKYIWNEEQGIYERLKGLEQDVSLAYFHRTRGLTAQEQANKRCLYGDNSIRIHLTPLFVMFFREVLSPFYIFQVFSCALWFYDDYYYYASCIVFLSVISITYSLYSIRMNERALRDIIHSAASQTVFRRDTTGKSRFYEEDIPSEHLVPGDLISIKNMTIMQCDAVLLNGNVIVNESMLTGESVPVTKTALANNRGTSLSVSHDRQSNLNAVEATLNLKDHSRHIIFSGTQVIQTRYYENEKLRAVVLRTGFSTTKGELVRSILHPKPVDFRFNNDTYKYIGALACIAFCGMIFSMVMKILKKNPVIDIIKRSLDIITIAVPPALPGALTAGLIYSQNRLRKQKIYCISPRTINICGTINTFVFDKTGTLTEDGLDLKSVLPCFRSEEPARQEGVYSFGSSVFSPGEFPRRAPLLEAMATCHSITRIHGDLAGDPLDLKMFEFTQWELTEPNSEETDNFDKLSPPTVRPSKMSKQRHDDYEIGIIKQFPFSSSLQRMSVAVKVLNSDHFVLYVKGSPEKITEMSRPETLPRDFQTVLTRYTREGYRVIAIAQKRIDLSFVKLQKIDRERLEKDLEFLGLIIMENRLKPETTSVINRLNAANVRTIMCTGDNILTGLSVARDCDMIGEDERVIIIEANENEDPKFTYAETLQKEKVKEIEYDKKSKHFIQKDKSSHFHFAVSGKSFAVIRDEHPDLLDKLAVRGTVFGRMSPDQKQQLVELLQELGYFVGMCGDGANDCGALKAANSGISLSNAEASVASPFTSKNPNIECVPLIIREGRSALVTSFGVVKFIVMYSMTQFISVIILYTINAGITDFEFLYIDLILVTFVAFFFSRTEPYPDLYKKPPQNKLIAARPIGSLVGHMFIISAVQIGTYFWVKSLSWFEAYEDSDDKDVKNFTSYENTAIFLVSMFQYITEAIIFSKGAPYRRSIFSNYLFMTILIFCTLFGFFITLIPSEAIIEFFGLRLIPDIKYRVILLLISVVHFFVSFMFESYIIDPDFLMNYDLKPESLKIKDDETDSQRKCIPKRANNLMPYHKIEIEIRKDAQWPPITRDEAQVPVIPQAIVRTEQEFSPPVVAKNPDSEILLTINNLTNETKKRQRFDSQKLETSF